MIDLERRDPPGAARAAMMLQRAHWAAEIFARYDRDRVVRIMDAVAEAAEAHAERYAEEAVAETGMGVVEHKILKNRMLSRGLWDQYRDHDFVSPRIDHDAKILELPRPAGVIFALTPVTNPIATVYFKVMLALMTRNAIVVSPHPGAKVVCADAVRMLTDAAVRAGAPDGCLQRDGSMQPGRDPGPGGLGFSRDDDGRSGGDGARECAGGSGDEWGSSWDGAAGGDGGGAEWAAKRDRIGEWEGRDWD